VRARFIPAAPALLLLGLALFVSPSEAQFFNAVYSRDALDVIAVGDSGALYRSVSGGVSWTRTQLGDKPLRDVWARDWNVVVVGDSGKVWRSANLGGSWALTVVSGTPSLRRVEWLGGGNLIAVGSGGTVVASGDGGASWSPQASGTSERLNAVRFVDGQNGWIAGTSGFVARTSDGGANWTPVALGTANELNSVDAKGAAVWVVGNDATAFRSGNGGDSWEQLNLHADARPDVKAVWVQAADTVLITGGGGFIRRSVDGGTSWSFLQHTLQGQIADLYFVGPNGWAASSRLRAVMRTSDGGATWSMPSGNTTTRQWVAKLTISANVRGSTIAINPVHKSTFYVALGNLVYRSRNDGETWSYVASIPTPPPPPPPQQPWITDRTNAFIVSPKDSNFWVAAVEVPDRIIWTDDAGASWHDALQQTYGEYGIPIEPDPDRPDTLYFGAESSTPASVFSPLYRSIDRGRTWAAWSDTLFRSPCDLIVVPESDSAVILVGDGITGTGNGRYWRSTGGATKFTLQQTLATASEIPGMASSRLRNSVAFGTNWGNGGVQRSTNFGLTWPVAHTASVTWGIDIAKDDPDVVIFGTYGGTSGYLSFTGGGGNSFIQTGLAGTNYGFYARDRATILAEMANGIYKLQVTQTMPVTAQSVAVTSPNGGEAWTPGSVHDITWNAANVALARIQYRRSPGDAWQLVAEVEGYRGRYAWTVPYDATASARVLVSDGWDQAPADSSDLGFTIPLALIAESPASLGYGSHAIGSGTLGVVTVTNPGTAPLTLSSITTGSAAFQAGRSTLTVGAGGSDTLGVTFAPGAAVTYMDQLTLTGNGYNAPVWVVPLYGAGLDTVALDLAAPDGGESWQYGTAQKIEWTSALVGAVDLAYQSTAVGPWVAIADSVPDAAKSYVWVIPDAPGSECVVRVRAHGGGMEDASKETFRITVPYCAASPSPLAVGTTSVGVVRSAALTFTNAGTAPLSITSVGSSNARFWAGRSALVVPAGGSDTVGVYYLPTAAGYDSATLTVAGDDPGAPHAILVVGRSVPTVSVEGGGPAAFALWPNRPNPFTGRTVIRYALPVSAAVRLEVYNLKGERVATLVDEAQGPGEYSVNFGPGAARAGRALPSGIYFYRFHAGGYTATHRMVMMN
jgi:photosystem II stability/assembly factor-like uncharacterized protein